MAIIRGLDLNVVSIYDLTLSTEDFGGKTVSPDRKRIYSSCRILRDSAYGTGTTLIKRLGDDQKVTHIALRHRDTSELVLSQCGNTMSYLLGQRNKPRATGGLMNRIGIARAPNVGRRQPMTQGGGGQTQQLLQRRQQTVRQTIHHGLRLQQQVAKETSVQEQQQRKESQVQGEISMEEVMEDLRVLEQQQRDSQRQLESVKQTKQGMLEQRCDLENELASITFTNGENRAQIHRCREVLSQCTRELGAIQLATAASGESLKTFDNNLKKALALASKLQMWRRKLEYSLKGTSKAETNMIRLNAEAKEQVKATEKKREEARRRESLLRKSIQTLTVGSKRLREETVTLRSESCMLDQDLATSNELLASTKQSAESIAEEIVKEEIRYGESVSKMRTQLEAVQPKVAEQHAKKQSVHFSMEEKKKKLHNALVCCNKIQGEEGHTDSSGPASGAAAPFLDVSTMRAQLAAEEQRVLVEAEKKNTLQASIVDYQKRITRLMEEQKAASQEVQLLKQSAKKAEAAEDRRSQSHHNSQSNLENLRREVEEMRSSKLELEEGRAQSTRLATEKLLHRKEDISRKKGAIEEAKSQLSVQSERIEQAADDMEKQKAANAASLEAAKQKAEDARIILGKLKEAVEKLSSVVKCTAEEEREDFKRAQSLLIEDRKSEIALLLENCPSLKEVIVTYDSCKSTDELVQEALADLRADCELRVEKARKNREERLQALKHERERLRKDQKRAERRRQQTLLREREAQEKAKKEAASYTEHLRDESEASLEAERQEEARRKRKTDRQKQKLVDAEQERKRLTKSNSEERTGREDARAQREARHNQVPKRKELRCVEQAMKAGEPPHTEGKKAGRVEDKKDRKRPEQLDAYATSFDSRAPSTKKRSPDAPVVRTPKDASDGKRRDGKAMQKQKKPSISHKKRPISLEGNGKESTANAQNALPGSQRRVTWGGLGDDFLDQDVVHARGATSTEHVAGRSDSELDQVLTQPSYSPGILTQLSQDDPRNDEDVSQSRASKASSTTKKSPSESKIVSSARKTPFMSEPKNKRPEDRSSSRRVRDDKESQTKSDRYSNRAHHHSSERMHSSSNRSEISSKSREPKQTISYTASSSKRRRHKHSSSAHREKSSRKTSNRPSEGRLAIDKKLDPPQSSSTSAAQEKDTASRKASSRTTERKRSSRQASGISSTERVSKAKRRRKTEDPLAKKKRHQSLGAMAADYDFRF